MATTPPARSKKKRVHPGHDRMLELFTEYMIALERDPHAQVGPWGDTSYEEGFVEYLCAKLRTTTKLAVQWLRETCTEPNSQLVWLSTDNGGKSHPVQHVPVATAPYQHASWTDFGHDTADGNALRLTRHGNHRDEHAPYDHAEPWQGHGNALVTRTALAHLIAQARDGRLAHEHAERAAEARRRAEFNTAHGDVLDLFHLFLRGAGITTPDLRYQIDGLHGPTLNLTIDGAEQLAALRARLLQLDPTLPEQAAITLNPEHTR